MWPKQLQQLEDITSHAHILGCSQCYCSEYCDCTVQSKRPSMMCGIGGAPFLGKTHPLEVFDLRFLYIPHPFIVTTTCICSPAHTACCVTTCRCHTPCIAMKINVRHVCVCMCVCVCVCVCEHMYSCILTFTHVSLAHILTYMYMYMHTVMCVCVYLCMVVTSWSLSQHYWGFQALSFWHSPLLLSM